jgi:hypothetical protein
MFHFLTKRRETELDARILVATAAINAAKDKARAELTIAQDKLALRIAERDAAPAEFKRAYDAAVKAQAWVCDRLTELAQ